MRQILNMLHKPRMFTDWLNKALEESGLGQASLARRISADLGRSIDRAAVNKMTKGQRAMSADELLAITRATGTGLPPEFQKLVKDREDEEESDTLLFSDREAHVLRLVIQALLAYYSADPHLKERLLEPAYQAALARIAVECARQRKVHQAILDGDQAGFAAALLGYVNKPGR